MDGKRRRSIDIRYPVPIDLRAAAAGPEPCGRDIVSIYDSRSKYSWSMIPHHSV